MTEVHGTGPEIVAAAIADKPWMSLLDNPRRTQAAAWNQGIDRARGDVIGIVSAHSELRPTMRLRRWRRSNGLAPRWSAARCTRSPTPDWVVRSRRPRAAPSAWAAPPSIYAETEQDVDTVYIGICPRTYRSLRFDEGWSAIRTTSSVIACWTKVAGSCAIPRSAAAIATARRAGLMRQYFRYGYWKVRVMEKHPRQVRARHLIPAVFVATLGVGTAASPLSRLRERA